MTNTSSFRTSIRSTARGLLDSECSCFDDPLTPDASKGCFIRRLGRRQHLFQQGDPQEYIYRIRRGAIRVYRPFGRGRRLISFALPGDLLGLEGSNEFLTSGQAIVETEVCCVSRREVLALAARDAKFALALYESASQALIATQDRAVIVRSRDPEVRVAAFLLSLYHRNKDAPNIGFPLLRVDVAGYLDLAHETVTRIFTKFRQQNLIELKPDGLIFLSDLKGLVARAEGPERSPAIPRS